MLRISNIRVRSLTHKYLQVAWDITGTFEDPLDYDLRVMRSEAAEGPYSYVSEKFTDKYMFLDVQADIVTRASRSWHYKLEVTKRATSEVMIYGPSNPSPRADPIATEMRRQAMLVYRQVSGRRCWLFPVRTTGKSCTNCKDPVDGRLVLDRCPTCFGTGWVRGYMDPVEVFAQFDPTPKGHDLEIIRVEKINGQVAHVGFYPEIKPMDLLVEPENNRWLVRQINTYERLRAVVRQDLVLDEVAKGSVHFEVPVNYTELMTQDFANPFLFSPRRTLGTGVEWPE